MIITRRRALLGLSAMVAAPAIVSHASLMRLRGPVMSMPGPPGYWHYKLVGKKILPLDSLAAHRTMLDFAAARVSREEVTDWFGPARIVSQEQVGGEFVSTVFLHLNHNFGTNMRTGDPVLFETMVFGEKGGETDGRMRRYTTWDDAKAGHDTMVAQLRDES